MSDKHREAVDAIEVVAYNPGWPEVYVAEQARILSAVGSHIIALEHIGSTAVPHLAAKPIIDMMAAVHNLTHTEVLLAQLDKLGYDLIETGMRNRLFLRNYAARQHKYHLHIVEHSTWDTRKERLMRDYLQAHPEEARAYGELKDQLAVHFQRDSLAYTRAKTASIQAIIDRARAERGLPSIDVWNDE